MNVNDNKDGIHQTESVINVNTKVHMELKCDILKLNECELIDILNEPPDGIYKSASVTKVPRNFPMSHLAGCTNRHPS